MPAAFAAGTGGHDPFGTEATDAVPRSLAVVSRGAPLTVAGARDGGVVCANNALPVVVRALDGNEWSDQFHT